MRLLVLVLSLGCVVAYGRALGELGGYFLGKGSLTVVGGGLLGGLWRGWGPWGSGAATWYPGIPPTEKAPRRVIHTSRFLWKSI